MASNPGRGSGEGFGRKGRRSKRGSEAEVCGAELDPRIAELLARAEQRWGRGRLVRFGDTLKEELEVIPTGFPELDGALGIGGVPCGRITEVFGQASSGKQALAARLIAQCQASEGVVAYLDPLRVIDRDTMRVNGVDFESLLVARPRGDLEALEMTVRLAGSGGLRLMLFDLAHGACGSRGGVRAAALDLALRRVVAAVHRHEIAFVFLSDADDRTLARHRSSAGPALRFYASVRLEVSRTGWIRRGREVVGCRSAVTVAKNKLAAPLRRAEVDLLFYRFPSGHPSFDLTGEVGRGLPAARAASGGER